MQRPHKTRLPKFRRTIPVKGIEEDQGKYFRCWNCGFTCKLGRDALNDGPVAITPTVSSPDTYDTLPERGALGILSLASDLGNEVCLMEADAAGDAKPIYTPRSAVVTSGCPMCGIKTWKG